MDFEKTYAKYKDGVCTDEEKAYIEEEIAKAQKLNSIIDELNGKKEILSDTDIDDVKKAKKRFTIKSIVRIFSVVSVIIVVLAAIICGSVFGTAVNSAKKNSTYGFEDAKTIGMQFVIDNYHTSDGTVLVKSVEKELDIASNLKNSVYVYKVEIQNGSTMEVSLLVDSHTGKVTLTEIERS